MAEKKPSSREQIKQIVAGIEDGIQQLFQSERYADYLRTMSRFHTYSLNNTILIHKQMPNATHVAGYNKWKNQFGRHVKQGEKGLTIIAPTPFKRKIEEMKLDRTPKRRCWMKMGMLSRRNGGRDSVVPPGKGVRCKPDRGSAPPQPCGGSDRQCSAL